MKCKFINNSCTGITRVYPGFELVVPGNKTVTQDVPDALAENVRSFLKQHHPAVEIKEEKAAPAPLPVEAAITTDASVLDINMDDQDFVDVTTGWDGQSKIISPVSLTIVPEPTPAPAAPAAPAPKKEQPAKKTGGRKK